MRKSLIAFLSLLVLSAPARSFAQTADETPTEPTQTTPMPSQKRAETMSLYKNAITGLKDEIRTKRMEAMQDVKEAREEFKAKLQTITDERKKAVVGRIDTRLSSSNDKHTEKMADNLEKLSSILERISTKAATLKSEGKDTTDVDTAIAEAQTKITAAQTAVATQAGKEYVITIADETTLGATISPVVTQFRTDIGTVHKLVVDAQQAVVAAGKELKKTVATTATTPTP